MNPKIENLNSNAFQLCQQSIEQADRLDVKVNQIAGATVLDFSVGRYGTLAAGIRLAEICLAGLADVRLLPAMNLALDSALSLPQIMVATDSPLAACIASQYAGWPFSQERYFAMCSGPARLRRGKEDILIEYDLRDTNAAPSSAVGIFESNQLPHETAVAEFAAACQVPTSQVTICVARTASFPGTIQVVARSLETTLHKLHELKFDLNQIHSGIGSAPLPPIAADDMQALGWTNDAILYGAHVNLWVDTVDSEIESILPQLPSVSSSDFGEPFLEIFQRYDRDFYQIDKRLFSPAQVTINNLKTGRSFSCGGVRADILQASFDI